MKRGHAGRQTWFETLEDRRLLSLTPASSYTTGLRPEAIVTADFNNDGHLDLATANRDSDNVSVLLGNANGTFGQASSTNVGDRPQSIAAGDFDDDGKLDLAVVFADETVRDGWRVDSVVNILYGKGDGSFDAPREVDLHDPFYWAKPKSVAVGDFNDDGTMDLALESDIDAYYPNDVYVDAGIVQVLLSHGDRTFANPNTVIHLANASSSMAVADFNGDGDLDVVVGEFGTWVEVALGDGAGRFVANYTQSWVMDHVSSMAVGDVNGDGDADLAAAADTKVTVRLGNGVGTFEPPPGGHSYAAGNKSVFIVLRDFDRDGRLDIVTANYDSNDVSILRGRGDGTFVAAVHYALPPTASADFNQSGAINGGDLAQWRGDFGANSDSDADGDGDSDGFDFLAWQRQLGSSSTGVQNQGPYAMTAADFNGDGWLDLATANANGSSVSVLINDRSWVALPPTIAVNVEHVTKLEGNGSGTTPFVFTVTLSAASNQPVTMSYRTVNGSAATGWDDPQYNDYVAQTGSLSFAPGQTTKTITIEVKRDNRVEDDEWFFVELFDNGSNSLRISVFGIGTILNDD